MKNVPYDDVIAVSGPFALVRDGSSFYVVDQSQSGYPACGGFYSSVEKGAESLRTTFRTHPNRDASIVEYLPRSDNHEGLFDDDDDDYHDYGDDDDDDPW